MGVPLVSSSYTGPFDLEPSVDENESTYYYNADDTEAETFVDPQNSPPLVNFTSGLSVYKWFRFEFSYDYDIDLFECGYEIDGRLPLWVLHTDESLQQLFVDQEIEKGGDHPNVDWALRNGVAPGQPFLVEFEKPVVSGSRYDDDVDVEYPCGVVRVLPKGMAAAGKCWAHTLKRIAHEHTRHTRRVEHFTRLGWARKDLWRIRRQVAFGTHLTLCVDPPGGNNLYRVDIAQGSAMDGPINTQRTPAFEALIEDFIRRYPDEDVAPVLTLSEVPYTAWDYLKWA